MACYEIGSDLSKAIDKNTFLYLGYYGCNRANEVGYFGIAKISLISENVQQIKELVRYLRFPIVGSVASKGFTIVRARRGDGYRTQTEVSYKTASLCKTAQRASLPNQTIFYGVLSDDERHLENARAICVAECSSLFREGILAAGREKLLLHNG